LKVYAFGSDDDYPFWDQLTPDQYCSTTDALTGITYRAIHQPNACPLTSTMPTGGCIPDLGCRIVNKADQAQIDYEGSMGDPFYKDRWRAWEERLEWARDLTRIFERNRLRIPRIGSCTAGSVPCGN
jgi:hypothetical protein